MKKNMAQCFFKGLMAFLLFSLPDISFAKNNMRMEMNKNIVQSPGYYKFELGDFKITVLTDGITPIPFSELLHGINKNQVKDNFSKYGENVDRETSINSFLIDTGRQLILIDTGSGSLFGECCGKLPNNIRLAGYTPEDINIILLTHVHGDHSGGLTENGMRVFPKADVYLSKQEFDYWTSDIQKSQAKLSHQKMFVEGREALLPYQQSGHIHTFEAPVQLLSGIRAIPAPGHTPGHTMYEIENKNHKMIIIGDIIHAAEIQLQNPSVSIDFDVNEQQAVSTRKYVLSKLVETNELVGAPHISFPGLGPVRSCSLFLYMRND